jgi:hypothetical protein
VRIIEDDLHQETVGLGLRERVFFGEQADEQTIEQSLLPGDRAPEFGLERLDPLGRVANGLVDEANALPRSAGHGGPINSLAGQLSFRRVSHHPTSRSL